MTAIDPVHRFDAPHAARKRARTAANGGMLAAARARDADLVSRSEAPDRPQGLVDDWDHSVTRLSPIARDGRSRLILVVEDDVLVAMDLAAALTGAGFTVLGPISTVQAALHLVARQRPDAAVLDVRLRNEMVTPLAHALQSMGVPFVIASGYSQAALLNDDVLSSAPSLGKPLRPSALIDAMTSLLSETSQIGVEA